eukprot:Skav206458  [mRNA]  locus=scaffold2468:11758:13589:- [translate_table: standard]
MGTQVGGIAVEKNDKLYPMPASLCVGFSWRVKSREVVDAVLGQSDLTLLEQNAVGAVAQKLYKQCVGEFTLFGKPRGLDWTNAELVVDKLAVGYMNEMYFNGMMAYNADRLIAAILHHFPDFGKYGVKKLRRMRRALRGYRKLTPGETRTAIPLADCNYDEYSRQFNKAAAHLGVEVTPHQARHSGPNIDRARRLRGQAEVQRRGQWKTQKSVQRDEKSATLAATFDAPPADLQTHCQICERELSGIMRGAQEPPKFVASRGSKAAM